VETGLLIRLEEELSDDEKKAIHDRINSKKGQPWSFTLVPFLMSPREKTQHMVETSKPRKG
jgi:hypothetical protein